MGSGGDIHNRISFDVLIGLVWWLEMFSLEVRHYSLKPSLCMVNFFTLCVCVYVHVYVCV